MKNFSLLYIIGVATNDCGLKYSGPSANTNLCHFIGRSHPISTDQTIFDIQLTKYDTWIARTDEKKAKSIYDTILEGEVGYRRDQSKQTSTIFGTKATSNDYNVGVSKKLPTGTTLSTELRNNRNASNSAFTTSPVTHDSTWGITLEQDLGQNLFGIQDRGQVKVTKLDIEQAEYTSIEKIEASIAEVQKAYWDLVLQHEQVQIEEKMVEHAKRLYDLQQEKLNDGLVEIPEAIASEANYKVRKNQLALAQNELRTKTNVLRFLLNVDDASLEITPTEKLQLLSVTHPLEESLKAAFEHRQDYKRANSDIKSHDVQLSMKKNKLWPEINFSATVERNGLGDHF